MSFPAACACVLVVLVCFAILAFLYFDQPVDPRVRELVSLIMKTDMPHYRLVELRNYRLSPRAQSVTISLHTGLRSDTLRVLIDGKDITGAFNQRERYELHAAIVARDAECSAMRRKQARAAAEKLWRGDV